MTLSESDGEIINELRQKIKDFIQKTAPQPVLLTAVVFSPAVVSLEAAIEIKTESRPLSSPSFVISSALQDLFPGLQT